ncbi:hypothetical protein G6F65_021017 [Rhizopus arrhizus]|nr:hypothetical protein G6F65_021017 [Rhizopus arrhizus]
MAAHAEVHAEPGAAGSVPPYPASHLRRTGDAQRPGRHASRRQPGAPACGAGGRRQGARSHRHGQVPVLRVRRAGAGAGRGPVGLERAQYPARPWRHARRATERPPLSCRRCWPCCWPRWPGQCWTGPCCGPSGWATLRPAPTLPAPAGPPWGKTCRCSSSAPCRPPTATRPSSPARRCWVESA